MSEINNSQIDNATDINFVIRLYVLIEWSDNYSETSGSLWVLYRDNCIIVDFTDNNTTDSFKFKEKMTS